MTPERGFYAKTECLVIVDMYYAFIVNPVAGTGFALKTMEKLEGILNMAIGTTILLSLAKLGDSIGPRRWIQDIRVTHGVPVLFQKLSLQVVRVLQVCRCARFVNRG